jgi:hypothetical protein
MANARRRTQRTNRTAARAAARNAGPAAAVEAAEARTSAMIDWQKEMQYINKDLRELLIITVSLFALLFIVGFFL